MKSAAEDVQSDMAPLISRLELVLDQEMNCRVFIVFSVRSRLRIVLLIFLSESTPDPTVENAYNRPTRDPLPEMSGSTVGWGGGVCEVRHYLCQISDGYRNGSTFLMPIVTEKV